MRRKRRLHTIPRYILSPTCRLTLLPLAMLKIFCKILPHSLHNGDWFVCHLVIERSTEYNHMRVIYLFQELVFFLEMRHNLIKVALACGGFQRQAINPLHSDRSALYIYSSPECTDPYAPRLISSLILREGGFHGAKILNMVVELMRRRHFVDNQSEFPASSPSLLSCQPFISCNSNPLVHTKLKCNDYARLVHEQKRL